MKGENNNQFKRPEFMEKRKIKTPFNFPRPEYLEKRVAKPKVKPEVNKDEKESK